MEHVSTLPVPTNATVPLDGQRQTVKRVCSKYQNGNVVYHWDNTTMEITAVA